MKSRIKRLREYILVSLTHKIALPMLKHLRNPVTFTYNEEDLQALPAGTFGNDLYLFLKQRNLPLLKHYARHDLKHVLLGYDTTEEGEACLQSFMLGNGRVSFPTVVYGFLTMPEYHSKMKKAYKHGKDCISIHDWKWNEILEIQTIELRKKMKNNQT